MKPDEIGIRQAAKLLGVHENTIRNYMNTNVLTGYRIREGGYRRLKLADVLALKEQAKAKHRPIRNVTEARLESYSPILMEGVRYRAWVLILDCGHQVQRRVKYVGNKHRGWGNLYHLPPQSTAMPAQQRVYCEFCGEEDSGV